MPATASAATAPVLRDAASAPGDNGTLTVSATSDSAITKITAHLFRVGAPEGSPEAATVSDFTLGSGTTADGVWHTPEPLRLADLGYYRIEVELTDADGDHIEAESSNFLRYVRRALMQDFQVAPTAPDYNHQDVGVSGRVVVVDPGTRERTPGADLGVTVQATGDAARRATTAADGTFRTSFVPSGTSVSVYAGLSWDAFDGESEWTTPVDVRAVQYDTRVTVDPTTIQTKEGQPARITGLAEMYVDGSWQPLPGATVTALYDSDSGSAVTRPVTGSDGRFAGDIAMPRSGKVEVQVNPYRTNVWLNPSGAQYVQVYVARKTSITGFTATLNKYAELTVAGRFLTGESSPADDRITIQYSADGRTGWTTAKTLDPGTGDPEEGAPFKGTFAAPAKGYYRAYFKGTNDWQSAYSSVVYAARTQTRISDANASPEPVRKGRTITVKGVLKQLTTSWKGYGSQKVRILFRQKGSTTWYLKGTTTTTSSGSFSKGFTAEKDGTWVAVFQDADSKHLVSSGREDYVDVQ